MTTSQPTDELYLYHLFLMTDGFRQNISCPWFNEDRYLAINEKIDEILASPVRIDHYRSLEERVIKIALAVCQYLTYDPEVSEEVEKDRSERDADIVRRIGDYEEKPLTMSLTGDFAGKGTCVSFSYIFAAACMKLGIDAYEVSGFGSDKEDGHSWNHVRINGEDVPIDVTAINNSVSEERNIYHDYLEKYVKKAAQEEYDDEIMDKFYDVIIVNYPKKIAEVYDTTTNRVFLFLPRDEYLPKRQTSTYYNNSGNLLFYEVNYRNAYVLFLISGILPASICVVIFVFMKAKKS